MAAKGRKERKEKLLAGKRTGGKFFHIDPFSARLLCVLCALSRLNFGSGFKPNAEVENAFRTNPARAKPQTLRALHRLHGWRDGLTGNLATRAEKHGRQPQ